MRSKYIIDVISALFMLLFFYTALNKLVGFQKFQIQIGQSPLLTGFGDVVPWAVIISEIGTGLMFMIPRLRLTAFYVSFSLMVMFTIYIIAILNLSPYVPCSCGGVLEHLSWSEHLVFNFAFVVLAVLGIWMESLQLLKRSESWRGIDSFQN